MAVKRLYYLSPDKHYYNYAIEGTCRISLVNVRGLYTRAYSIKQAILHFRHTISQHDMSNLYDIDIDSHDIEILED